MFGRHRHGGERLYGRGPFGFHGGGMGGPGRGGHRHGGRGPGRMFDQGDLRFVLLKLIADQPAHGYELIKAVEQAVGGAYSPSPGVIYPTLTLLEDLGYIAGAAEAGSARKLFSVTETGRTFLGENTAHVERLFARMAEAAGRSALGLPQILRAQENLRTALRLKLVDGALGSDQVAAIAKVLDDAAQSIEAI